MNWMILDAAALGVLVLFVIIGRHRGFLAMALLLVGTVASFWVAQQFAAPTAQWVYDNYAQQRLTEYVEEKLEEMPQSDELGALTGVLEAFSEEVELMSDFDLLKGRAQELLQSFGKFSASRQTEGIEYPEGLEPDANQQSLIEQLLGEGQSLSEALVEVILQPLVLSFLELLAFLIIFGLCNIVIKLLIRASKLFNKVPLVGGVNRFFGGVCGLLEGVLVLYVLGIILRMAAAAAGPDGFITTQMLQETYLLSPIIYFLN